MKEGSGLHWMMFGDVTEEAVEEARKAAVETTRLAFRVQAHLAKVLEEKGETSEEYAAAFVNHELLQRLARETRDRYLEGSCLFGAEKERKRKAAKEASE